MIKRNSQISINVMAVLVVLLSLLLISVGVGNAWFVSSNHQGIQLVVNVGELNIKLYQNIGAEDVEIYTNINNSGAQSPSYVVLPNEIAPDTFNTLQLKLLNSDAGASVYVRYKFQLYACDYQTDSLVTTNLTLGANMVKSGDYYYYKSGSNNLAFAEGDSITLLTGFEVPYSSFANFSNSQTLKLVLQIEYSNSATWG